MTCPDPANNRECLHLHNGECLASQLDDKPIATFYAYDYDKACNYANWSSTKCKDWRTKCKPAA